MNVSEEERISIEKACEWLDTPEGREDMANALRIAQRDVERIRACERLDHEILNEPITL